MSILSAHVEDSDEQQDRGAVPLSRPRRLPGARASAIVLALALFSVVGCGQGDERVIHDEGDGILSASSSSGGKGLLRPHGLARKQRWQGSFGGLLLCVTDEESGMVRVNRVRYEFAVHPQTSQTWVRTVPELAKQHPGQPIEWAPFYGRIGGPGAFRRGTMRGDFTAFEGGMEISDLCEEGARAFTELVTVLDTGPGGAWSRLVLIDYTYNGNKYTLRVPWEMATCGKRTHEMCHQ
jgi:hypothetical protein